VGNCIGLRNQRYFVGFLWATSALAGTMMVAAAVFIAGQARTMLLFEAAHVCWPASANSRDMR